MRVDTMRQVLYLNGVKEPLVRLEYESKYRRAPVLHWQFHGERGALSFILARAGRQGKTSSTPKSLSDLHFPTGGRRFRPGVEDFLQFLIQDCGFDAREGWARTLKLGREEARRTQARTVAGDFPNEVAESLRQLGWSVEPPDAQMPADKVDRLQEY
ncbi:hypothetical protein GCM10027591_03600 [Zhihengliuella somnathii]